MNHATANRRQGFTIIELMLAMTFIAILLLAIAMTIIQVGNMYNRGMTLKELNVTGRDVANDIREEVSKNRAFSLTRNYVTLPIGSPTPVGGRLCVGSYSYVWNYGRVKNTNATGITRYDSSSPQRNDWVSFVKVADREQQYCALNGSNVLRPNIIAADISKSEELLKAGDHELAVHNVAITTNDALLYDSLTYQQLYSLTMVIGTNKYITVGANRYSTLNTDQSACLAPNEPYADPDYCAVADFSIVLRAGSRF